METPAGTKALWDRAIQLHGQSRFDEAIDCLLALEALLPDHPGLLANLGVAYRDSGDLPRAEHYLRRACAVRPKHPASHFNLALTLLRAGRLREGFEEYEWRWQVPQFAAQRRDFAQPLWRGEPLAGRRILIHGEQGAGDAIQFVRYAPLLRAAGADVILQVLPHLERLLSWMEGQYPMVNSLPADVPFDLHCPLMSLPHRFATEVDSIPAPAGFLVPAEMQSKWRERLRTAGKSAGVVWAGNPWRYHDEARSLPVHFLPPLTHLPGIDWWSLQVGPAAAETPKGMVNLADELTDFGETAAVISALDLVITVDTAAAHLAGSLGRPVWLLLPFVSDWRWMLGREDSPWYPSVRIFRQPRPGDWGQVMERVVGALRSWAPVMQAGN
jgi:tetratricopeptide (TPR) repeat protein